MKKLLLTALFMGSYIALSAHPHIFIDIKMEVKSSNRLKVYWTFDLIESQNRIYFFDDNSDNILNNEEVKNLYNESFKNIEEYNYFITVNINEDQYPVREIYDFSVKIEEDGRLTNSFEIETPEDKTYSITHFDTSYFIAFSRPIESDIKSKGLYIGIYNDKSTPFYYDPNGGRDQILDTSKPQPGWLTAYPTKVFFSNEPVEIITDDSRFSFWSMIKGLISKLVD